MRIFNCSKCSFHVTEADKVWDEYQTTNKCPNCEIIKAGYISHNASGKSFIGLRVIRRNRIFAGLIFILLAIVFYITPTTFHSGKGSSLISIIQSAIGNEGVVLLLLIIGAHFTYNGLKK